MDKRSNRIDELIGKTKNIHNKEIKEKHITYNEILSIKSEFPKLFNCDYIRSHEVNIGEIIRYVDLDKTKMSVEGIIIDINYYSELNEGKIKTIMLYNRIKKNVWKIYPKNVYMFKVHRKGKIANIMEDFILGEDFKNYISGLKK
jgi:hypothetical protein